MIARVWVLSGLLALTALSRGYLGHAAVVPERKQFATLPLTIEGWMAIQDVQLPRNLEDVLNADDYLDRTYRREDGSKADLFMSYYRVQRAGENMHSPKNCLPGSGWQVLSSDVVYLNGSNKKGLGINRYIVEKDGELSTVFYWYAVHGRMVANEYWEKAYLVEDGIRTGRHDGALVRITVPINNSSEVEHATTVALSFTRELLLTLPKVIPS